MAPKKPAPKKLKPPRIKVRAAKKAPAPKRAPAGFRPEVRVYATPQSLFEEAAHLFLETAREAVAARGRFVAALSGGSTPKGLFQQLAEEPYLSIMPWDKTFLFWVDERHVPFTDETSNYRMTMENLLSKVPLPADQVTPGTDPKKGVGEAAAWVESRLKRFFGPHQVPVFDLCLMGMGDDGHTASLFPGTPQLNERSRWVVGYFVDEAKKERVTLTFPVLNAARLLMVLTEGAKKTSMLKKVLEGPSDPPRYPIQYLRPAQGRLLFLVDEAAAANLAKK